MGIKLADYINYLKIELKKQERVFARKGTLDDLEILYHDSKIYDYLRDKIPSGTSPLNRAKIFILIYNSHLRSLRTIKRNLASGNTKVSVLGRNNLDYLNSIMVACDLNNTTSTVIQLIKWTMIELKNSIYYAKNNFECDRYIKFLEGIFFNSFNYVPDLVIYNNGKSVLVPFYPIHKFGYISLYDKFTTDDINLLNIMSFLFVKPSFPSLNNESFQTNLYDLYSNFDITNCMLLRRSNIFSQNIINTYYKCDPYFKCNTKNNYVCSISKLSHPELLELYNASLKQFDPLSRCLMLFRIIECSVGFDTAFSNYFASLNIPERRKIIASIEYYWNRAVNYKMVPIVCDTKIYGPCRRVNFISVLKNEGKKIIKYWTNNSNNFNHMNPWEIIYISGRCGVAHGDKHKNRYTAKYDYGEDFKRLNDINIILEVICRYLIEFFNPCLKAIVC